MPHILKTLIKTLKSTAIRWALKLRISNSPLLKLLRTQMRHIQTQLSRLPIPKKVRATSFKIGKEILGQRFQGSPLLYGVLLGGYILVAIGFHGGHAAGNLPNPMPLISKSAPAFGGGCNGTVTSGVSTCAANDGSSTTRWSSAVPATLTYNLSSIPAAQRGKVIVAWYNDPMTSEYDHSFSFYEVAGGAQGQVGPGYNNIGDYTIEANTAPTGGSAPTTGWKTLVTVTGNTNHSRQHLVNLKPSASTTYNWIRLNVTASDGSTGNTQANISSLDIFDASSDAQDDWLFLGDSITQDGMSHAPISGTTSNFSQLINAGNSAYFPAFEDGGIGGVTTHEPLLQNVDLSPSKMYIRQWLDNFPGHYVGLSYGTNDANGGDCSASATNTFYTNYQTMVQEVLSRGKVPVIPTIPASTSAGVQSCGPSYNAKIQLLYTNYPQIIHGPDLWTYYAAHPSEIGSDQLHPNATGYTSLRREWANAMLATVYAGQSPDSFGPVITNVASSSVTTTTATIKWTTDEVATSQVEYGPTTAYGSSTTLDNSTVTSHTVNLSGLTSATQYHYRVKSTDAASNPSTGDDMTFTTAATNTGTALHAVGSKIYDSAGQEVILHGVNKSGSEYACVGGWGFFDPEGSVPTTASVNNMKAWTGLNAVRVPMNEDCWLGINGSPAAYSGANYQAALRTYVDRLKAAGLIPMLELHWSAPGTNLSSFQRDMPDRDHSPTFWSQVAAAYKGDDTVIFDLFNEPNGLSWDTAGWACWRDGGTDTQCHVGYTIAGMQELVTAVRNTGAQNLIMLGGQSYSNLLGIPNEQSQTPALIRYKPTDPLNNLAASWHVYGGNTCDAVACWDGTTGTNTYNGQRWNGDPAKIVDQGLMPLIAGEFGEHYDSYHCQTNYTAGTTQVEKFTAWMEGKGASYMAWAWDPWGYCSDLITGATDASGNILGTPTLNTVASNVPGTPLNSLGSWYKTHLASQSTTGSGGSGSSSDTSAPTTAITSPTSGSQSNTITVNATASDDSGTVTNVELYADGVLVASDNASPYSFSWDTTTSCNGNHTLTTKAYDPTGNIGTSSGVTLAVNNTLTTLNDNTTGAGACQFNYSGGWNYVNSSQDPPSAAKYQGDDHYATTAGNSVSLAFSGTQVKVYVTKASHHGIVNISIDGGAATPVDEYNATTSYQALAYTSSVLTSGNHTLTLTSTNNKNAASTDIVATIDRVEVTYASGPDTTPPDTTITAQPSNPSNSTAPSFSFSSTETGSIFECKLDAPGTAGTYASCTSPKAYTSLTTEGSYTFSVRATDAATNTDASPATYTWTIDTTAPNTSINSSTTNGTTALPTSPSYANVQTAAFAFSSTESSGATFQCRLDTPSGNGTYASCTSAKSYTATNLNASGTYTFRVRASDAATNQDASAATFSWNIDIVAPAAVNLTAPAAGFVHGTIAVTSGATDSGGSGLRGVQFKLDGANLQTEDATSPYSINWDTTTATAGSHTLTAVATDNAGNTTTASNVIVTVDNVNPTGSLTAPLASANVHGNAVNLTASSADGGSGVANAKFQRSPAGGNTWTDISTDSSATGGYTATWDSTAVTDGLYDLRVTTTDNAGNSFTSPLVTNVRVDNTAPTSVTVSAPASYVSGSVSLTSTMTDTGSSIASAKFQRSPTGAGTWTDIATVSSEPFNTSWNTTGLNAVYDLRVIATDNAGNATTSPTVSVTVDNTNPTTATITAPTNGFTANSAAVTLSATAADNTGGSGLASVQFKLGGLDQGPALTTAPYSTSWDPSTLGDGSYQLTVVVTDKAGNSLTSAAITVNVNHTTPPPADTTAPSAPASLRLNTNLTTTTTSIPLTWNASQDNNGGTGVNGYKIYRNNVYLITVIGLLTYTDQNLTPGTSYNYQVSAIDNANPANESAKSNTLTASTASNPIPPVTTPTLTGDLNGDSHVNIYDLSIFLSRYGSHDAAADFNHSGTVEIIDLSTLLTAYGK